MRSSFLLPEKVAVVFHLAAFNLAWFLGLAIADVPAGVALVTWAVVSPLFLWAPLSSLARLAARRTEDEKCPQRTRAVVNYLRGQVDPSLRSILDCCARLDERSRHPEEHWRIVQEAATIHGEAIRLREALSRALRQGCDADAASTDLHPRTGRRAIAGYVRRASGVAKGASQA